MLLAGVEMYDNLRRGQVRLELLREQMQAEQEQAFGGGVYRRHSLGKSGGAGTATAGIDQLIRAD